MADINHRPLWPYGAVSPPSPLPPWDARFHQIDRNVQVAPEVTAVQAARHVQAVCVIFGTGRAGYCSLESQGCAGWELKAIRKVGDVQSDCLGFGSEALK